VLSATRVEVQTGTSYIRWGRKTCGNASLVYTGNINKQKCIGLTVSYRINNLQPAEHYRGQTSCYLHEPSMCSSRFCCALLVVSQQVQ